MSGRLARPEVDEDLRFTARLRTRWVDEDNQGVLNNAVQLTLLEEARHAYFTALDLMDGARFPFVLAQCNLVFVAPGRGGAPIEVALSTPHVGNTSFRQVYRVREVRDDGSAGDVWLEAEALLVGWDNDARTKAPLSATFKERVVAHENGSAD